jgi:hypothetical protein
MAQPHIEIDSLAPSAVADLRGTISGHILLPDSEGYETARHVWNGMVDKRPWVIVRCVDTADVIGAVNVARRYAPARYLPFRVFCPAREADLPPQCQPARLPTL